MRAAIVSSGFEPRALRLQPHRTLLEMGRQLVALGHGVVLLSDGADRLPQQETLWGLPVRRVRSIRLFRGRQNRSLMVAIEQASPDLLLWHLGLCSFAYQALRGRFSVPVVGILTSPIHRPQEILRLGPAKLSSNPGMVATHLAGTLVPGHWIRRAFGQGGLHGAITFSETTRQYLVDRGVPAGQIWTVPPGVDPDWLPAERSAADRQAVRCRCGFGSQDWVVTYFGSPAPVRGLYTLLRGAALASRIQRHTAAPRPVRMHQSSSDPYSRRAASPGRLVARSRSLTLSDRRAAGINTSHPERLFAELA